MKHGEYSQYALRSQSRDVALEIILKAISSCKQKPVAVVWGRAKRKDDINGRLYEVQAIGVPA